MQQILVTGAAGFIGSNLTQLLLEKGYGVWGIDNFITGSHDNLQKLKSSKNFEFIEGDIAKYPLEKTLKSKKKFDIIFHLASPASPVQYTKHPIETLLTNALGTKYILDYLIDSHSERLVFSSTSEVYGDPQIHPQTEDYFGNVNPVGPRACYDEGKRYAEALITTYARMHTIDARIARIFNTYGPNMERDDGRVISNFICQALQNSPLTIYGDGKQTRSFCYVDDMVEALFRMGTYENLEGQIINVGNPDEREIQEIAKLIKEMTNSQSSFSYLEKQKDDPQKRRPDIARAKKLLKWEPHVSLEKGIVLTISYFKSRFFQNS